MRKVSLLLCAVLVIAVFSACGASALDISFTNDTEWSFTSVSISDSSADSPGDDLLGGTTTLKAGGTVQLSVASVSGSGLYDIRCVDEDEDIWLINRVPVPKGASLAIYLNNNGYPAIAVTDSKGGVSEIIGEFESGATGSRVSEEPEPTPVPAPSQSDPLDMTYDMQSFPGGILIPYPSTMQVLDENAETRTIWLDAVNDPDVGNNIGINFIQITNYDKYFASGDAQAQVGLEKLFNTVIDLAYKDYYIKSIGSEFVNGGSFYGLRQYIWLSGDYYVDGGGAPIRGVMELRYFGPTGYLLCVLTTADENAIQRYYEVALNITNAIPFGGDWSTGVESSGGYNWSDPGDTWGYDPWSDPGDGGWDEDDYYYDDGDWYESNDAGWDDDDYYYDDGDWYESNDAGWDDDDYYYDDGDWYESNDAGW